MTIGTKVESRRDFADVPKGTNGFVVEDYGTGITIAWDLPNKPYPKELTPFQVSKMWAINPKCPLRDGFDKETELQYLRIIILKIP